MNLADWAALPARTSSLRDSPPLSPTQALTTPAYLPAVLAAPDLGPYTPDEVIGTSAVANYTFTETQLVEIAPGVWMPGEVVIQGISRTTYLLTEMGITYQIGYGSWTEGYRVNNRTAWRVRAAGTTYVYGTDIGVINELRVSGWHKWGTDMNWCYYNGYAFYRNATNSLSITGRSPYYLPKPNGYFHCATGYHQVKRNGVWVFQANSHFGPVRY